MKTNNTSFIVRIWIESVQDENQDTTWRGTIEHVGTAKQLYFYDMSGMVGFVKEHAGLAPADSTAWWRSLLQWFQFEIKGLRAKLENVFVARK